MKRIKLLIKKLTLLQQFIMISLLIIGSFLVLFYISFRKQLDNYAAKQIFTYLHQAQNNYVQARRKGRLLVDYNVINILYDDEKNQIISNYHDGQNIIPQIMSQARLFNQYDGVLSLKDKDIIFSARFLNVGSKYLITLATDTFQDSYRKGLYENIVSFHTVVIILVLSLMFVWIASVINPIRKIKNYLTNTKNEKEVKLELKRNDEIGQLANSLVNMQEEYKHQNRLKEEIIQKISHDLKTPIAVIKNYGESIKDGIYPYDTLEKSVDVIIEQANRLENRVFNLINFNKVNHILSHKQEANNVVMDELIKQVILGLKVLRPDVILKLDLQHVCFKGDEESFRIVVENLIDNALRYAQNEVAITLKNNYLSVYNDGSSISSEELERLFKPYQKGRSGHFGLGLSIVKKVVDTYGYQASIENYANGVIVKVYKDQEE